MLNAVGSHVRQLTARAGLEAVSGAILLRAGAVGLDPPQRWLRALDALRRYGPAGAALVLAAQRYPDRTAIVDERGSTTFAALDRRSNAITNGLLERGVVAGDTVGVLCRNHRGFLDALGATAKLGARTLLLNTDFSGPQLADVCAREDVALLITDEEFAAIADRAEPRLGAVLAWPQERTGATPTLEDLVAESSDAAPPAPRRKQQIVLLTSGTTGSPKGAPRDFGMSLAIPGGYLAKIPLRSRRAVLVCAPVFHAWGLLSTMIAIALGDTIVVRRKLEPQQTLQLLAEHRCDAMISVPILLSRLLELGPDALGGADLSALRVIAVSGSALPAELSTAAMNTFGEIVYNLYGSTEVAYACIATPQDLRAAPGCVGMPPPGTTVRLYDQDGIPVATGEQGRIFVGNSIQFTGYTGGGNKEVIDGLMSTGDVGHFDAGGRLFIDGRDDDMIVSGGENVFPAEIEDLLAAHPQIREAAVVGVPDPDFGHRLRAFVVRSATASDELDEDAVRDHVRQNLARFKVPRDVVFVDGLPRNPAGKVVKARLLEDS